MMNIFSCHQKSLLFRRAGTPSASFADPANPRISHQHSIMSQFQLNWRINFYACELLLNF